MLLKRFLCVCKKTVNKPQWQLIHQRRRRFAFLSCSCGFNKKRELDLILSFNTHSDPCVSFRTSPKGSLFRMRTSFYTDFWLIGCIQIRLDYLDMKHLFLFSFEILFLLTGKNNYLNELNQLKILVSKQFN